MRKLTDSVTGLCSVNRTRSQVKVICIWNHHYLILIWNKWMCECKNTLWTFILTPMGILPNREYLSRLQYYKSLWCPLSSLVIPLWCLSCPVWCSMPSPVIPVVYQLPCDTTSLCSVPYHVRDLSYHRITETPQVIVTL